MCTTYRYDYCGEAGTVGHLILHWKIYEDNRAQLIQNVNQNQNYYINPRGEFPIITSFLENK